MFFQRVHIQSFRNIQALTFEPSRGLNVIEGRNGQGKTSLLEALNLTTSLRSFRGHPTKDLIQLNADRSAVLARFHSNLETRDVELTLAGNRRSLRVNGDKVASLNDYFGHVRMVTFIPDDVAVFRAGPAERRLFFDRIIFGLLPAYAAESSRYEAVLKQRNALLRHETPDLRLLDVYDEQLADAAVVVAKRRTELVDVLREPLKTAFYEVFGAGFDVEVLYETPCHSAAAALTQLQQLRRHDLQRGHTSFGPHRDDFAVSLNGQPFKNYGSQGQHRALVLACKIAEMRLLKEKTGSWPILLMDDISSELDPLRNQKLFSFLSALDTQVFLTTTSRETLHLPGNYALWYMKEGDLTHENLSPVL